MSAQAAKPPWAQLPEVFLAQGPTTGVPVALQQRPPPARPALTARSAPNLRAGTN